MKSEAKQAKKRGARLHPRSGAGKIKADASDEETVYEFKDANLSHSVKADELQLLFKRATRQGKEARYVVRFGNGIVLEGTLSQE